MIEIGSNHSQICHRIKHNIFYANDIVFIRALV
jgi:hypothetical protein